MKINQNLNKTVLSSLLRESIESDILSMDSVLDMLMSTKKNRLRNNIRMPSRLQPKRGAGGRPGIKGRTENERISKHNQRMSYGIN